MHLRVLQMELVSDVSKRHAAAAAGLVQLEGR